MKLQVLVTSINSKLQQSFKVSRIACWLSFNGFGAIVVPSESKSLPPTKQNSLDYRNQSFLFAATRLARAMLVC